MTPPNPPDAPDIDVGLPVDVDISVAEPDLGPDEETPMSVLVRFQSDVTPAQAESLLGRLEPPDDGIILAAGQAVIVRARAAFVEEAKRRPYVDLVHPVQMQQWVPSRHRISDPSTR